MAGRRKSDTGLLYEACMKRGHDIPIKATDVATCIRSPFQLYCNYFADSSEMDPVPDQYLQQLSEVGKKHEKNINDKMFPGAVPAEFATPEDGFRMVIDAMTRGTESFMGAPVFYMPDGMYGVIDQLVRVPGRSDFGGYHYVVNEIKVARNIKDYHIFQGAFYNYIIGRIQGHTPDTFTIINMDGVEKQFAYEDYEDRLFGIIEQTREIRQGEMPSPTFGSCIYPWNNYCNRMAMESGDVSLLSGVSLKRKNPLVENGIRSLDDVISSGESELVKIPGIGEKTARRYVLHATALANNEILRTSDPVPLPERTTEIFLDLEGLDAPTIEELDNIQTDYLIGMLVRRGGEEEYVSFVAHSHEGEEQMLREFIDYVRKQEDYVIYHWHHYERTHLAKMMERYRIRQKDRAVILAEDLLFDLHPITTGQFTFPIPGTGLKDIAKFLGFSWKHVDVGAMSSIELYCSYARNSDQDSLDLVLDYNRDDCEATKIVKDWLVEMKDSNECI